MRTELVAQTTSGVNTNAQAPAVRGRPAETLHEFADEIELPLRARATLYALSALIMIGICWANWAKLDIVVVADGRITTEDRLTVLQPFELSVVRRINVRPGDHVSVGQVVAELDPTIVEADAAEAESKAHEASEAMRRISAEMQHTDFATTSTDAAAIAQHDIFVRRRAEEKAHALALQEKLRDLDIQIEAHQNVEPYLTQQVRSAEESERIAQVLSQSGEGSKIKLLDAQRATADARGKLAASLGEARSLVQQREQARAEFQSYMEERARELSEEYEKARAEYDDARSKIAKAVMRGKMLDLSSPIEGTVLEVAKRANGSVVREAETLVTIVPNGIRLVADARIQTRDISRLSTGNHTVIKLESLPYQQFGTLEGKLKVITPDTIDEQGSSGGGSASTTSDREEDPSGGKRFYRAQIELTKDNLHGVPAGFQLRPGMKIAAEINVGTRSVLEYILNPITRSFQEGLREP